MRPTPSHADSSPATAPFQHAGVLATVAASPTPGAWSELRPSPGNSRQCAS